jgi:predicted histidine transporter YuiF (NhaC family)
MHDKLISEKEAAQLRALVFGPNGPQALEQEAAMEAEAKQRDASQPGRIRRFVRWSYSTLSGTSVLFAAICVTLISVLVSGHARSDSARLVVFGILMLAFVTFVLLVCRQFDKELKQINNGGESQH